jgi:hypothetical protein
MLKKNIFKGDHFFLNILIVTFHAVVVVDDDDDSVYRGECLTAHDNHNTSMNR